jgi:hypothetical protein
MKKTRPKKENRRETLDFALRGGFKRRELKTR